MPKIYFSLEVTKLDLQSPEERKIWQTFYERFAGEEILCGEGRRPFEWEPLVTRHASQLTNDYGVINWTLRSIFLSCEYDSCERFCLKFVIKCEESLRNSQLF